jgi:hypothetical protein
MYLFIVLLISSFIYLMHSFTHLYIMYLFIPSMSSNNIILCMFYINVYLFIRFYSPNYSVVNYLFLFICL